MKRFILIESKTEISEIHTDLDALFTSLIHVIESNYEKKRITYLYDYDYDLNFEEVVLNMLSDTLYDLILYQSHEFEDITQLNAHKNFIIEHLKDISNQVGPYLNDRKVLKALIDLPKALLRERFLRKYQKDSIMIETLHQFFMADQNISKAAKELYIHRNTLIQRLDKFYQETGFDVRKFQDAVLIYQII